MPASAPNQSSLSHFPALQVREATPSDQQRWETFVESCPEATFFHRFGWKKVIEEAFGHRIYLLLAECEGTIEGILPLGEIRSRFFGHSLISTPFCVYGGVAATTERARRLLTERACELANECGVQYLELRNREERNSDWQRKDLYVTFRKEIDPDPEKNLLAIPRKQRAMVRKGIAANLESVIDDDIERFFRAYSESVRNLGTPVFSKRYFRLLKETFGNDCELLTVVRDNELVASVMSFYFRDEVLPYYGGGKGIARDYKGNDFMYWEVMKRACQQGVRWFDYGRSKKGTGSYRFKTHWGFEPEPLHYEVKVLRGAEIPEVNPLNPKYAKFIAIWKRLPLSIANRIGPLIANDLG